MMAMMQSYLHSNTPMPNTGLKNASQRQLPFSTHTFISHRHRHSFKVLPDQGMKSRRSFVGPVSAAQQQESTSNGSPHLAPFPEDYPQAIKQAQAATLAALANGAKLIEIEFPSASLSSVAGDAEGANEMTYSSQHLRQFTRAFKDSAASTRIFFPDKEEMVMAKRGKTKDPNAGSWDIDAVWDSTAFQLDYLSEPNFLLDIGIDLQKFNPADRVSASDELLIMAYPHFDPREMIAVDRVYREAARDRGIPIIMFNAELERCRGGYYPALFYPQIARLTRDLLPLIESSFYIHNFKGAGGGAVFRCYPGPWQVLLRMQDGMMVVHTQEERPTLKEVALEILPRAVRKFQQQQQRG